MWRTIGHERELRFLQRALAQRALSHALLLVGPQAIGKTTLAIDLAAALLCRVRHNEPCWECQACRGVSRRQHADFHLVQLEEDRKSIRMEQIGALQQAVALRPYQSEQRVSLILQAHLLQPEASQRLLKTLEEPPAYNTLILTAESTHLLPQTLVSRCQVWRLTALPRRVVQATLEARGTPQQDAAFLAAASLGRLGWALQAATNPEVREQEEGMVRALVESLQVDRAARTKWVDQLLDEASDLERLFDLWIEWWRSCLLSHTGASREADSDSSSENCGNDNASAQEFGRVVGLSFSILECVTAIKRIHEARDWIRANVSPRLALETLVLHLPETSAKK